MTDIRCLICETDIPAAEVLNHLRINHPDDWEPPEMWPDGRPVIIDTTLAADDFCGGAA